MCLFQKGTMIPVGWTEKQWKAEVHRQTNEALGKIHAMAKREYEEKQVEEA